MNIKPEIALLGPDGMLGSMLYYYLEQIGFKITAVPRQLFDVTRDPLPSLGRYIPAGDSVVINCIVHEVKSLDYAQTIAVNALFPRQLAYYCTKRNIRLIHISTNAVFSGMKGDYLENDVPDPTDFYGISKLLGEDDNGMVLRTSIIGHERLTNKYLLEWAISQKGRCVNGFSNHFWNGMTTLALAEAIGKILDDGLYAEGIFHLYTPEKWSKLSLLSIINEVYQLDLNINSVEAKEYCDRTLSSNYGLSASLITANIREQLEKMSYLFSKAYPGKSLRSSSGV